MKRSATTWYSVEVRSNLPPDFLWTMLNWTELVNVKFLASISVITYHGLETAEKYAWKPIPDCRWLRNWSMWVSTEDLLDIYILYIRSIAEYCSTVFHSSLTVEQSEKIERIQKTCLKVILGDMFIDYASALEMSGLETLFSRRKSRCLNFALKSAKHSRMSRIFPLNKSSPVCQTREQEKFEVNFARTSTYRDSTVPYCQRLLNTHYNTKTK